MTSPKLLAGGLLSPGETRTVRCDVPANWTLGVMGPRSSEITYKRYYSVGDEPPGQRVLGVELKNTGNLRLPFTLLAASPEATMTGFHALGLIKSFFNN